MYRLTQTTQRENVKSFQALEKQGSLEVVGCQGVMAGEKEAIVKTANWVPELPLFAHHVQVVHLMPIPLWIWRLNLHDGLFLQNSTVWSTKVFS